MPDVIGIDHIYVTVTHITRSEPYYDAVMSALGFRKNAFQINGDRHVQYYNRHFGYVLRPARSSGAHDPYAPGLHHLCFRVEDEAAVVEAARSLQAAGIAVSEPKLYAEYAPDYHAVFLTDPDGIRLEITNYRQERRERHDAWGESERTGLAMANGPSAPAARVLVETYIRAKDENRPYLMERAFAEDATLEMIVHAGTLSFPPASHGRPSITDVLVRRFAQTYENVHTFCLAPRPQQDVLDFSCHWLVGMSEKESSLVRVGCGRYDWRFQRRQPRAVERLVISIDQMQSLAPACLMPVMRWLSQLPYPWCAASQASRGMPILDELQPIQRYLDQALS